MLNFNSYAIFESMNIAIGKSLENFINDKVANGEYSSTTDVIEKALCLLQEQEEKKKF